MPYGEDSSGTSIIYGTLAGEDNDAPSLRAAYVFLRESGLWSQQAYLKASNAESEDFFGIEIGISGGTIVVSATGEDSNQTTITNGPTASDDNSLSSSGAVYVFRSWEAECGNSILDLKTATTAMPSMMVMAVVRRVSSIRSAVMALCSRFLRPAMMVPVIPMPGAFLSSATAPVMVQTAIVVMESKTGQSNVMMPIQVILMDVL